MSSVLGCPLQKFEKAVNANWVHLRKASERATLEKSKLRVECEKLPIADASMIVFGSLARNEFTAGSDIDWTLLVDGRANRKHLDLALDIETILEKRGVKPPGREGTFGGLAFSHDITHKIGGNDDTNKNTTQRILLLLESDPIGVSDAYNRVICEVLNRYVIEDWGWMHDKVNVPRFLLNDIVRYWRTLAVDFGYKRRQRRNKGWALRTVKLRMSRKLTYASGLLACYACALDDNLCKGTLGKKTIESNHPVVEYLAKIMRMTPLDIVANTVLSFKPDEHYALYSSAKTLINSYDEFIGLLDDDKYREHLDNLSPESAHEDEIYMHARDIGHRFQDGLNGIFIEENGTKLFELTKKFGVF